MTAEQALHLATHQERLELDGWRFAVIPPRDGWRPEWLVCVRHVVMPVEAEFRRPLRHDALGQALQWALLTEGDARANEHRDTLPAPPMEDATHAAE